MTSKEVKRFDISFKDPMASYKAGDVVCGNVMLDLGQDLKMKAVKFNLQGVSRVSWDEKRSYSKGAGGNLDHKKVDIYLDENCILLSCVENNILKAGTYNWPFTIRLPPYLPASFDSQYGKVQYWAKAVLDQPWKKDTEIQKAFNIIGILDLNTEKDARMAISNNGEVMAGRLCLKSGPIEAELCLQQRGFSNGENISFSAKFSNHSKNALRDVYIQVMQQVDCCIEKKHKRKERLLKGITWRDVQAGEKDVVWEDVIKGIPAVVPSRLGAGCKNIGLKYVVMLGGRPSSSGVHLEVPVEVIMGTVPFRNEERGSPILTIKAAKAQFGSKQNLLGAPKTDRGNIKASPDVRKKLLHAHS